MNNTAVLHGVLEHWTLAQIMFLMTLLATSLLAWCRQDRLALLSCSLCLVTGFVAGHILPMGAAAILLSGALAALCRSASHIKGASIKVLTCAQFCLAMLLYLHWVPGFLPWQWLPPTQFRPDGATFVSFFNADKVLAGSFLLMGCPSPIGAGWRALWPSLGRAIMPTIFIVCALMAPAIFSGYVRFDPKLHPLLPLWAVHNLVLVILHEEVMFRAFLPFTIQRVLPDFWSRPAARWVVTSAAFGAYHYTGGLTYVILSSCAGVGYELARRRAGRLEGAMMAHFALNLVHFIGFTYPSLARPTPVRT